jgi:hypothetical protein
VLIPPDCGQVLNDAVKIVWSWPPGVVGTPAIGGRCPPPLQSNCWSWRATNSHRSSLTAREVDAAKVIEATTATMTRYDIRRARGPEPICSKVRVAHELAVVD